MINNRGVYVLTSQSHVANLMFLAVRCPIMDYEFGIVATVCAGVVSIHALVQILFEN